MPDPTTVKVNVGATINTGNFESIRVDVEIGDFVRREENIDKAYNRVYGTVERLLLEKVNETRDAFKATAKD